LPSRTPDLAHLPTTLLYCYLLLTTFDPMIGCFQPLSRAIIDFSENI
jgi:hypothetical protein